MSEPDITSMPRLTLTLDMEKYLGQIDDWRMSESQKREFIEALWGLLISAAELGLEISPVHMAQNSCGQLGGMLCKPALTAPNDVYLSATNTQKPNENSDALSASDESEI